MRNFLLITISSIVLLACSTEKSSEKNASNSDSVSSEVQVEYSKDQESKEVVIDTLIEDDVKKEEIVDPIKTSQVDGNEIITGTCAFTEIKKVKLEQSQGQFVDLIKEVDIVNGQFKIDASLEPGVFYRLNFEDKTYVLVYDDFDELHVDVKKNDILIKGSRETRIYTNASKVTEPFTAEIQEIQKKAMTEGMTLELREKYQTLMQKSEKSVQQYVLDNSPSVSAFVIASDFLNSPTDNTKFFEQLLPYYKDFDMFPEVKERMEMMTKLAIGKVAPEITLKSPIGTEIKLTDFRGKYVLIDFWASWCRPCMAELPNVKANYEKYKSQGFEILGVSSDRDPEAWKRTIMSKEMKWNQVWDEQQVATQNYNVMGIPYTILLDREGRIIAKNLRGEALGEKLEELFKG